MILNEEDFEELATIPAVETDVIPESDILPNGPTQGEATGISNIIHDLIISVNEMIQDYNNAAANMDNYPELQKIMHDIAGEEFTHIGELQKALEVLSPNAANIEQGEVESEENLDNVTSDTLVDEGLFNKNKVTLDNGKSDINNIKATRKDYEALANKLKTINNKQKSEVKEALEESKKWLIWVDGNDIGVITAEDEEEAYKIAEDKVTQYGFYTPDTIIEVEPIPEDYIESLVERYKYRPQNNLNKEEAQLLKTAIKFICLWQGDARLTYASGDILEINDDNRRAYGNRNILKGMFETAKEIGDPIVKVDCMQDGKIVHITPLKQELLGYFTEDTEKNSDNKWVNKGKDGEHGEFKTKKEADAQRKAMFANGFKESLINYSNIVLNNDGSVNYTKNSNNYYYASVSDLKEELCNELDSIVNLSE